MALLAAELEDNTMLKIKISGNQGEGKTLMLNLIGRHLHSLGFDVTCEDEGHLVRKPSTIDPRALKKAQVKIISKGS